MIAALAGLLAAIDALALLAACRAAGLADAAIDERERRVREITTWRDVG